MTATLVPAAPPTLGEFLDAGCDLAELLGPDRLVALAEQAVEAPRVFPAEVLAGRAPMWRGILDDWLAEPARLEYSDDPQRDVLALSWRIELLEDPGLAKRVEAALPPDLVQRMLDRVDCDRRPFVLAIEQQRTFRCVTCGELLERSRVVRLTPRGGSWPDVGDLPPLTFCPDCISRASLAARAKTLRAVPPIERLPAMATCVDRVGFVRRKLMEQGFADKSVRHYCRELMRAELWCEDHGWTLRNVPEADFARYVDGRPRTQPTRQTMKSALGHYWRILPRKNAPLWLVRVPKKRRGVCRTHEEDEARIIVAAARARGDDWGLAVLAGMYLGLRREEIAMLRWDGFSVDGWLTLVGKGEVEAKLPVHPVVLDALAKQERRDPTWVFPGRFGGHVSPATIWSWFTKFGRDLGIEDLTPHRARHTCLATANDRTGDLRAVQDFARHSKVDTTSMYTRSTARRLVEVMRSLDYEGATEAE